MERRINLSNPAQCAYRSHHHPAQLALEVKKKRHAGIGIFFLSKASKNALYCMCLIAKPQ